ncbi:MAG: alpha/beta hydrolase [Candidatus Margulisiibacteriota bacterium]
MKIVYLHGWAFSPGIWKRANCGLSECTPVDSSAAPVKLKFKKAEDAEAYHSKDRSCVCTSECASGFHNVYCPDLYAFKPPFNFENIARQLYGELKSSGEDIVLVGWSMGGNIALELYQNYDLPIKGLVLISSTPKFMSIDNYDYGVSPGLCRSLRRRLVNNPYDTLRFFRTLLFPQDSWGDDITDSGIILRLTGVTGQARIPQEALLESLDELYKADYRKLLPNITVPTLIIHGQDDRVCPVESAEYLYYSIPDSQLSVLKEAGHMPFITQSEQFQELMNEFIRRCQVSDRLRLHFF